jgi:hypothetical protein
MPFGRTPQEQRWFRGWYEHVIELAIIDAGFIPILAAAQEQPEAINDEIRRHLAMDEMVVVDLGGINASDPPNSNVMYELGIRHAFGLPLVMLAWEGQALPFDISNQRAIMSGREMLDIAPTRKRLINFIAAAKEGRYYRPMDAVGRHAQLAVAASGLNEESVLKTLIEEIEDLKRSTPKPRFRPYIKGNLVDDILSKSTRKRLHKALLAKGIPESIWIELLKFEIPLDLQADARQWESDSWISFLYMQATKIAAQQTGELRATGSSIEGNPNSDESTIESVRKLLPAQPWPKNIHKMIATSIGTSSAKVTRAINVLIQRGVFLPQINGVVHHPSKEPNDG